MNDTQAEARASSNDKIAPGRRFIAGHVIEKRNGSWQIWDNGSLVFSSYRLKPVATWARGNPRQLEMCPGGCGCRLGTEDADDRECGCEDGCCD